MKSIGLLQNTIQFYAWGSASAIPDLLGEKNPTGEPWAELWMGAHPKAPSEVYWQGCRRSLIELIRNHPQDILGPEVSEKFDNKLPYLFKILAADQPLSIQAHPSLEQARAGFERENRKGIPLDDSARNYRDANHKPECICAISKFFALCGFRAIPEIVRLMTAACPAGLAEELARLETNRDSQALKRFYTALMTMEPAKQKQVIDETLDHPGHIPDPDCVFWMKRLAAAYPGDIGMLSPMLLNLVCLEPGQALFLPAGELHSYLHGLGVELMANSDNVLRGGLTAKHIDLPELLKVVRFEPRPIDILQPAECGPNEKAYISPAREFVLTLIAVTTQAPYLSSASRSVEILLCTDGQARLQERGAATSLNLRKGNSVMIPAAVKDYQITGSAVFYKAAVPIRSIKPYPVAGDP